MPSAKGLFRGAILQSDPMVCSQTLGLTSADRQFYGLASPAITQALTETFYASGPAGACKNLECLMKVSADDLVAAQEELIQTAPLAIPGIPFGERESLPLPSSEAAVACANDISDPSYFQSPFHPLGPYRPSIQTTWPTLFSSQPTPHPTHYHRQRSRPNHLWTLSRPSPPRGSGRHYAIYPLIPRGAGTSSDSDWIGVIQVWQGGRCVQRDV
jgi:hypothetical protein